MGYGVNMINIEELKTITLKPGQVVVYRCDRFLSRDKAELLFRQLEKFFPDNRVLVIDGGSELLVVDHET